MVDEAAAVKLKLTSWNILAPVWAHPSFYPKVSQPLLDKVARRNVIAARMREFDSDVMHLQEVEEGELDAIRAENSDLDEKYEYLFMPFPEMFWSNWLSDVSDKKPVSNGIAVLLRKVRYAFHTHGGVNSHITSLFVMLTYSHSTG